MSKYYKKIVDGYIIGIGTGIGENAITREEYETILSVIRSCPAAEPGYVYKLRTDLTWERTEAPKEEADPEISDAEAVGIIMGVIE